MTTNYEVLLDISLYSPIYVSLFWGINLLITSFKKNPAHRILSIFMFSATLIFIGHLYFYHIPSQYFYFEPVYTFSSLSLYPLYLLYVNLLSTQPKVRVSDIKWFIPAIVLTLTDIIFKIMLSEPQIDTYNESVFSGQLRDNSSTLIKLTFYNFKVSRLVFTIQLFFTVFRSIRLVKIHNETIHNYFSKPDELDIAWIKHVNISMLLISVAGIIFNSIGKSAFLQNETLLIVPSILFSSIVFLIGFSGFRQNTSYLTLSKEIEEKECFENEIEIDQTVNEFSIDPQTAVIKSKLETLFSEKKVYLQPDLKIWDVCDEIQTNRSYLSGAIKKAYDKNFCQLVNTYRIEEAKKLILQKQAENYSLDAIAYECGFGSLNSFMRIFKELEGITPGQYRQKHAE